MYILHWELLSSQQEDAVAQRRGSERKPIKAFSANSIPVMLGNEKRVYGVVKPHIKENLKRNVQAQVRKILEG